MTSVLNGAPLSAPTMISPNNYLSGDRGSLDPDDQDPLCGNDQGLTDEDTYIDLGPEWRDGASDPPVRTPPPDPVSVPQLPPPMVFATGGIGVSSGLSVATPPVAAVPVAPLVSSMKEAIQLIVATLASIGIVAVNKAGLFVRLGVALCAAGYRYIVDERGWVRRDDEHGYHLAADVANIIGFALEWTLSNPLAGERAWLEANIPQNANPLVEEGIQNLYAAANAVLSDNLPWNSAALKQMTGVRALQCQASDFDRNPELLNTPKGFINLRDGSFTAHNEPHNQLFRQCASCLYDPLAECPRWHQFLREAHPDDAGRLKQERIIPYLQYIAGTMLVGNPPPNRSGYWIFGASTTGKSIFTNVLANVVGSYAITLPPEVLMRSRSESRMACGLADIRGKRVVFVSEIPDGQISDTLYKVLTSHDRIKARALYRNATEFKPTHTLVTTTNHRPVIDDAGGAVFQRICPIPFQTRVAMPDPDLERKLMVEASGILNWMIAGARRALNEPNLYREPPALVRASLDGYRQVMDIANNFIEDCCEVCAERIVISTTSLIAVFKLWTSRQNHLTAMSGRKLLSLLDEAGYKTKQYGSGRQGNRMRGITGLTINEEYADLLRKKEREEIKILHLDPEP